MRLLVSARRRIAYIGGARTARDHHVGRSTMAYEHRMYWRSYRSRRDLNEQDTFVRYLNTVREANENTSQSANRSSAVRVRRSSTSCRAERDVAIPSCTCGGSSLRLRIQCCAPRPHHFHNLDGFFVTCLVRDPITSIALIISHRHMLPVNGISCKNFLEDNGMQNYLRASVCPMRGFDSFDPWYLSGPRQPRTRAALVPPQRAPDM